MIIYTLYLHKNWKKGECVKMKYEKVFTINEFVEGATIHHSIGVHTNELCITEDPKYFRTIYYNLLTYLRKRSDIPGFKYLYSLYSQYADKLNTAISLPYVRIANGIAVRLYSYISYKSFLVFQVKIIINPILFMASYDACFDPRAYDYTFITMRTYEFWKSFGSKITDFLTKWDILNDGEQLSIMLARIDFCVDIAVPKSFPIAAYIKYMHRILKRYKYNDDLFDPDFYAHQSSSSNKSQTFSIYEKIYEQKVHHHNYSYGDLNLIRLRYVLRPKKIREILSLMSEEVEMISYESVTENKSFDQIIGIIRYLIMLSPVIFIYGINLIFPRGSIIPRLMARRRVKLFIRKKNTRYALYEILDKLSRVSNYSDIVAVSNRMKESFGQQRYYRFLCKLRELGLSPMYLDKEDVEAGITSFPCVYDLFISAITNTEEEYQYLQNFING